MEGPEFSSLPEGCISYVISLTSPRDACRSSAVSSVFQEASDSDFVWERFLPRDYSDILSRAVTLLEYSSKKGLYFILCNSILIDDGKKSFWLQKLTGKKCYMLSAGELRIVWAGSTPDYWDWVDSTESRFPQVAELFSVCWLEITGKFNSRFLSPRTHYVAYLILKFRGHNYGLDLAPVELKVKLGDHLSVHQARLRYPLSPRRRSPGPLRRLLLWHTEENLERVPRVRGDEWMELELGRFYNADGNDGYVEFSLLDGSTHWKRGLIIEGVEIRPSQEAEVPVTR
ncbi:F-box protein At2g02240-like [Aristolochia californica]|uniref:F-box protein At2g02240-like n=1 Tax=Aristolochia californica TaxID=171875 RepID=UPI0035D6038A